MIITIDYIKSLDPCQDGIDNFERLYPDYSDSLVNLLSLDDISYEDKIWLAIKAIDVNTLVQWSVECAEFVVDNYNKVHPNDSRVSDCIEMTKKFIAGECGLDELNTALSKADSAHSATYSARSAALSAVCLAHSAALSAESATKDQEDINLSLLIALLDIK